MLNHSQRISRQHFIEQRNISTHGSHIENENQTINPEINNRHHLITLKADLDGDPANDSEKLNTSFFFSDEEAIFDWQRKDGEDSVAYCLRVYFECLSPVATHEENCSSLLYEILQKVLEFELNSNDNMSGVHSKLRYKFELKLEAFIKSTILAVPVRTWKETVKGIISPRGIAGQRVIGTPQPQISADELKLRISFFIEMIQELIEGNSSKDKKLDLDRCEFVVKAWVSSASECLPLQRPTKTLLPPLLFYLACDILGVRVLGVEVMNVISNVVSTYENRTRVMMSPFQNASTYLRPLLLEFSSWLRENLDILIHASNTEALVRCVDSDLRYRLKNQVYQSAEHFLSVFQSLSPLLTDIELPNYDDTRYEDEFDFSQIMKDVNRERFIINGMNLSPTESMEALKNDITTALKNKSPDFNIERSIDSLHVSTCVWKALHAASRTASGGDSFFIVQDLFGGDGVLIKPTRQAPNLTEMTTKGLKLTVRSMNTYDIYHFNDVAEAEDDAPNALMTVGTILEEIIEFLPFNNELHSKWLLDYPSEHDYNYHKKSSSRKVDQPRLPSYIQKGRFLTITASLPVFISASSTISDSNGYLTDSDSGSEVHIGRSRQKKEGRRPSVFQVPPLPKDIRGK